MYVIPLREIGCKNHRGIGSTSEQRFATDDSWNIRLVGFHSLSLAVFAKTVLVVDLDECFE